MTTLTTLLGLANLLATPNRDYEALITLSSTPLGDRSCRLLLTPGSSIDGDWWCDLYEDYPRLDTTVSYACAAGATPAEVLAEVIRQVNAGGKEIDTLRRQWDAADAATWARIAALTLSEAQP